ncbi:uncharacterized protein [Physcomitrium patens]|uniref:uncharacterized protein isoform X2 n=1 Tax=Physcomitrium patens TaxID=3218 RepID=UPI000D159947|nr:uncharacterized protein LOC112286369 isoform X2 [Physcomitrium patens]|eukprot:XP_024383958.1 uncharacterized protein LOC112286369 isoform X2 [Physcomitrella patens]
MLNEHVVKALESEGKNGGLYQDLKPRHSSEYISEFETYDGSKYDAQAYFADVGQLKISSMTPRSYELDNSSEHLGGSFPISSGKYETQERACGTNKHEQKLWSNLNTVPNGSTRSYSHSNMPPSRAAPTRPDSCSDINGSSRNDYRQDIWAWSYLHLEYRFHIAEASLRLAAEPVQ